MLIANQTLRRLTHLSNKDEYECCEFLACHLASANLTATKFIECEFVDCNLSNILVNDSSFIGVRFKNCKMLGVPFDTCNQLLFSSDFEGCQLDHSVFFQMKLKQATFINCTLENVDFSEADLRGSKVVACNLHQAKFDHTHLEGADFTRSFGFAIDPELNPIARAKFSQSQLAGLLTRYHLKVDKS